MGHVVWSCTKFVAVVVNQKNKYREGKMKSGAKSDLELHSQYGESIAHETKEKCR